MHSKSTGTISTAVPPHWRPSTPGGRATPAGRYGDANPLGQRRHHDVEVMLNDSNLKVDRLTSKLTGSHQEVQRLRTQLEARDKDLIYQTRLADRVKREQSHVQADADAHKEMAKRLEARLTNTRAVLAPGGGDHNTAALAERVQRLTARLQGEQDAVRTQKRETVRDQMQRVPAGTGRVGAVKGSGAAGGLPTLTLTRTRTRTRTRTLTNASPVPRLDPATRSRRGCRTSAR